MAATHARRASTPLACVIPARLPRQRKKHNLKSARNRRDAGVEEEFDPLALTFSPASGLPAPVESSRTVSSPLSRPRGEKPGVSSIGVIETFGSRAAIRSAGRIGRSNYRSNYRYISPGLRRWKRLELAGGFLSCPIHRGKRNAAEQLAEDRMSGAWCCEPSGSGADRERTINNTHRARRQRRRRRRSGGNSQVEVIERERCLDAIFRADLFPFTVATEFSRGPYDVVKPH